jgi:hypothetical protein
MKTNSLANLLVAAALFSFLAASVASADYGISGEWYQNRGSTVNIPIGQFDGPCPQNSNGLVVPKISPMTPATPNAQVPSPCVRHQTGFNPVAFSALPQSGIPAQHTVVTGAATPNVTNASIIVPPSIFVRALTSVAPVPVNPAVQQLDTSFSFNGPAVSRVPTLATVPTSQTGQHAPITDNGTRTGFTRLLQTNAWNRDGQPSRAMQNFNFSLTNPGLGITRRVTYTGKPAGFGGTMGMFQIGVGRVWVIRDLTTLVPGNELLRSPLGGNPNVVHAGRGYKTTQKRAGASGAVYASGAYGLTSPGVCPPGVVPATPNRCKLIAFAVSPLPFMVPGANTTNIGFPWTTGHVSVYVKGIISSVPLTTTLTAAGNDSVDSNGIRTIQLVAGGVALRNQGTTTGRTPHVDTVTIKVPEPGSTMALVGALGLIGGLYGVRRRLF